MHVYIFSTTDLRGNPEGKGQQGLTNIHLGPRNPRRKGGGWHIFGTNGAPIVQFAVQQTPVESVGVDAQSDHIC
jgi:hypothetical protein